MLTLTDLFAGAGGSSTGAVQVPGVELRIAANHWATAIEIHNANHPDADHAHVDLHLEDPAYFPKTDILWASPECTKWSQAGGGQERPPIEEGLFENPDSDDVRLRSRLLMFDVLRFVEHHRYRLVIVENVVDIAMQRQYATAWQVWRQELSKLGYAFRVVSLNSMHAQLLGPPAPQSRDRLYVVAWPEGERAPDIDRVVSPSAYCPRCDVVAPSVQAFKPGRTVGRYRAQYLYLCRTCNKQVEPGWLPAASIIDWSNPGERIGDRLKDKTRARIAAGIARYWGPTVVEAAGNQYDAADPRHRSHGDPDGYFRAWSTDEPLKTLHTSASKALAVPVEGRDGKEASPLTGPLRTQTTRQETALVAQPFMLERRFEYRARSLDEPVSTITANDTSKALIEHPAFLTQFRERVRDLDPNHEPLPTIVADGANHGLVEPPFIAELRGGSSDARPAADPLATVTAGGNHHALVMRNNTARGDQGQMSTPVNEYLRTLTTAGHQSLIQDESRGKRKVTVADMETAMQMVPDCLFRMLTPAEIALGMAFPHDYDWAPSGVKVSNRDLVKAAGNAVTPPAARDLVAVAIESIAA
jgi:DNA (cytosine-5)-methyltransferase 1